jgi:membrane protease YdiL (CAAX protease family)
MVEARADGATGASLPGPASARLRQGLVLVAAIQLIGALGPLASQATWGALGLYGLGSLALLLWRVVIDGEAEALFLRGAGLHRSLLWGGGLGLALLLAGLLALPAMRASMAPSGGALPLEAVHHLLFGWGLILLLPLLVLAEEALWRSLLLSSLLECGIAPAAAVALSTLGFTLNHLAVAPLALPERAMLALMALPLGLICAVLTLRTRVVWGGVLFHTLVIGAMLGSLR